MSLLTLSDLIAAYKTVSPDKEWALGGLEDANKFANAIEAAVIRKLATVSVEPVVTVDVTMSEIIPARTRLYTETALAAARVQVVDKVVQILDGIDRCEGLDDDGSAWWETSDGAAHGKERLEAIRALIQTNN